jgi:hypothetical protein
MSERTEFEVSIDYGMNWPIKDWDLDPWERPDWKSLLSAPLQQDLKSWCTFFNEHADETTGLFGSEERRRWFDLEGFRLWKQLEAEVGDKYTFRLNLWF